MRLKGGHMGNRWTQYDMVEAPDTAQAVRDLAYQTNIKGSKLDIQKYVRDLSYKGEMRIGVEHE
jgi:hypothetical protein